MKCTIPEISWHNRDPVLSVDIQPNICNNNEGNQMYRLASGGTDSHILIWYMTINESGSVNLDLAADLTRHQRAVNVVKWSPNGEFLASGDDESVIFIWKLKGENEHLNIVDAANNSEQDKETWIVSKILRGHIEDVYDLCWSPNSQFLLSGSIDNTAIVWDIQKGKLLIILKDHKGFVQGVAWDPFNQYLATLSTDRYLRIFDEKTKKIIIRNNKCLLPLPEGHELHGKTVRIFHDDTLQTFFRRLCFSPDGKLIVTPAGVTDFDGVTKPVHTTYVYSRYSLKQPIIMLPSPDQYTIAVKFCPVLYKLRPHNESNPPVIRLPYRMVFAVATKMSVYLYDTQQKIPFGLISNIHYTRLTDLTWSNDGRILVVSSTDGFCSLITFSENELGEIYVENENSEQIKANNDNDEKFSNNENHKNTNDNDVEMKEISTEQSQKNESSIQNENENSIKNDEKNPIDIQKPIITCNLIIDKDIISSDEKFESPEKKYYPVTPISIRRHPRNESISSSGKLSTKDADQITVTTSSSSSSKNGTPAKSNSTTKKAPTPIASRKHPRVLIPNPVETTQIVEEAVDAWPISTNGIESVFKGNFENQNENNKEQFDNKITHNDEKLKDNDINLKKVELEECGDRTEDIRLIYEESQDDNQEKETTKSNLITEPAKPIVKTPKRVEFKTISTPKKIK